MREPKRYVAKDGSVSWRVRYRAADMEKSETFYTEDDAVEFSRLLKAIGPARAIAYLDEREKAEGGLGHAYTVNDIWAKWFAWKSAKRKDGTPIRVRSTRTTDDYARMYDRHIRPTFGEVPANLVTAGQVQTWVERLEAELRPKTIADYHSLLHSIFLWAIHPNQALTINDPCTDTKLPMKQKNKAKGLRPAEWQILQQAAREVDPAAADLLLFLVSSQWRWSEAVAAQTMCVDHWIENGESFTYLNMGRVLRREGGNRYAFVDDSKSEAGLRRVRVRGEAEQMILRRIEGKPPEALILTTGRGTPWAYNNFHQRVWTRPKNPAHDDAKKRTRITERATELGLNRPDLTLHWLRHTGVGMLILAGEPLTAISRRVGHASIKTTVDVYGSMVDDTSAAGLDRLSAMIDGTPRAIGS